MFWIVESMTYLMVMTGIKNYSTMITLYTSNEIFIPLYMRPFAPAGYCAFGAILSIFYYEFSQSSGGRNQQRSSENDKEK